MPYGFTGNASQKYLSNVGTALSGASTVCSKNPFDGVSTGACSPPPLSTQNYRTYNDSNLSAANGGYATNVGNQSNVVVNGDLSVEILQRIRAADAAIAEELYRIAVQIEDMCETIYIVPATLPRYLAIIDKVKASLGEFQSLAEQAGTKAYEFVGEITKIDG